MDSQKEKGCDGPVVAPGGGAIRINRLLHGAMRFTARLTLALFALVAALGSAALAGTTARAAEPFTVTISPASNPVPVGSSAVFHIRLEGQMAVLPSFNYDIQGGTLTGVASLNPTAANVAEGSVYVTRDTTGMATLSFRLGSTVLATGSAQFAQLGSLSVSVTLNAGIDAAARTWRYEVLSTSGQVVASLTANTSGDAPVSTVSAPNLQYGYYTVRQVLGSDTRTSCTDGAFYRVSAPTDAETTLELGSASAAVSFTIEPCPGLPSLSVSIPVDTIAPGPGVVGDADVLPGETPISEVRGTRQEGPGNPLPPSTGNSPAPVSKDTSLILLLLVTGATAMLTPAAAWSAVAVRSRRKP